MISDFVFHSLQLAPIADLQGWAHHSIGLQLCTIITIVSLLCLLSDSNVAQIFLIQSFEDP
jgi:hypothetical protein